MGRKRRDQEALERSFSQVQFSLGKKTWNRHPREDYSMTGRMK